MKAVLMLLACCTAPPAEASKFCMLRLEDVIIIYIYIDSEDFRDFRGSMDVLGDSTNNRRSMLPDITMRIKKHTAQMMAPSCKPASTRSGKSCTTLYNYNILL